MGIAQFLKEIEFDLILSLLNLDLEHAEEVRQSGCPHCGGKLDRSDYTRRPRGLLFLLGRELRRVSFCCRDCRARTTPKSLLFMGRKVYVGLVVVLASHLRGRESPLLLRQVEALSGARGVTIRRWLKWWRMAVLSGKFWRQARADIMPPLCERYFPSSLCRYFYELFPQGQEWLRRLLSFLSPLTIPREYPS